MDFFVHAVELAGGSAVSPSIDIRFESAGSVQTPLVLGYRDGELAFAVTFGFEVCQEACAVFVEGFAVLGCHGRELAG